MTAPSTGPSRNDAGRDPVVVLASDDQFAMPLAVTVRSALDNLAPDVKLRVYVLDGGLSEASKQRLLRSWPEGRFQVEWICVDAAALGGLPVSGHVNLVSYFRILVARLLPANLQRVIYLDSDLVIRADLAQLWQQDLAGQLCLAARDCAAPYMDCSAVLPNFAECAALLGAAQPVPNFRELGLRPDAAYLNAGVLLIDLDAWRAGEIARRMLECLQANAAHVRWWDQYALNVVLANCWGQLDMRWNQGSHAYFYPTWEASPFDRKTFELLRDDPYIVHFTTRHKPWHASCRHPLQPLFVEYLDRTDWAGTRPARLEIVLEFARTQERRLRRGRKWLQSRMRQLLRGNCEPVRKAA